MRRPPSPCESDHRVTPLGWNVEAQRFEFTTARQPFPWRAAGAWSAIAGLASFFALTFVVSADMSGFQVTWSLIAAACLVGGVGALVKLVQP